ncbi:ArnT family glycosyltransferase [Labilibaculum manganireducens]|nr:glycosyltransferase family 39 protein [Labilibaculum manganireducens]
MNFLFSQMQIRNWIPAIIFFISLFSLSVGINGDIFIVDEARNAECAREMLERGDLIVPTYNYELRTDKPPLHYYFMMISYSLFGVSEWSARLFSVLFGCFTILISYLFAKRWLGIKTAVWTVVVLLSSIHFSVQFHMSVPDPYLIFFITSSLFLFFDCLKNKSKAKAYLMYLCLGLGALTKGPIAIALPGLIMLLYLIFSKQFSLNTILLLRPFEGLLIVLFTALPWYLAVHQQTDGAWTKGFFLEHNLERFANTKEGHGGTLFMAPVFVLAGMLPFSVFFIRAIKKVFVSREKPLLIFALTATLCIVGFFAASSTRLPNYTAPAYPFFAIVLAHYLSDLNTKKHRIEIIFLIIFSALLIPAVYFGLHSEPELQSLQKLAVLFLPSFLASIAALYYYRKNKIQTSLAVLASGFYICSLMISQLMFSDVAAENPVKKTLALTNCDTHIVYFKKFNASFPFYLKRKIETLETNMELEDFFTQYPQGIVISQKRKLNEINFSAYAQICFEQKDLFEGRTTTVLKSLGKISKTTND